jgi:hypothetical protein
MLLPSTPAQGQVVVVVVLVMTTGVTHLPLAPPPCLHPSLVPVHQQLQQGLAWGSNSLAPSPLLPPHPQEQEMGHWLGDWVRCQLMPHRVQAPSTHAATLLISTARRLVMAWAAHPGAAHRHCPALKQTLSGKCCKTMARSEGTSFFLLQAFAVIEI